jgi:DNA-binding response OmpR family regulator
MRAAIPARSVLIVEDAETCATMLEMAFARIPDVNVLLASSGIDALHLISEERNAVRAVVTDLNMPRMDGFELIRRIRANARHALTPIIVISGDTDPRTPERALNAGADAYFAKPYSPAQVTQRLEQLLDANPIP